MEVQDSELIEFFSESSMMSKSLEEYGDRKSCAITTAKRLAQFLGDERIKDKGLACNYVVATCALNPNNYMRFGCTLGVLR
jgi:DNA polymerase epsilon subunit 1